MEYRDFNLEEESRADFLVSTKRKKVWYVELKILEQFDMFCRENNLTYFVDFGALLGAVRHKGFIPWDDDIDVTMPRPDYQLFLELAPKWFKEPYFVQNYYTDSNDNRISMISKIRDDRTTMLDKNYNFPPEYHQGIFLDVFPLDVAPSSYLEDNLSDFFKIAIDIWTAAADPKKLLEDMISGKVPAAGKDTMIEILGLPYEERLRLFEGILASNYEKYEHINVFSKMFKTPSCKKEWYSSTVELPFENTKIKAPIGYIDILKARYTEYIINWS